MRFIRIFSNTFINKIFIFLFIAITILGCKKKEPKETINYTNLIIEQDSINSYFNTFPESDSIINEVNQFYKSRDYQYAWFNEKGIKAAAPIFNNKIQNYNADFNDPSFKNKKLDSLISLFSKDRNSSLATEKNVRELEFLLTTTFFRYSHKVYGGITKNTHGLEWFIPRKKKNYQKLLDSLVTLNKGETVLEPVNKYYKTLKQKLKEYRGIDKKGGFHKVVTTKKIIITTESDSCLIAVKHNLFLTGDLKFNDKTIVFTDQLAKAVANFQHRMGLNEDGKLNDKTITEINRPVEYRIKQMMLNLERLRWVPVEMENEYLLVNIPEYRLHIIENNKLVWSTNVVVGKDVNQTNIFKGNISSIILNPYWNIPNSIIKNEIVPHMIKNPDYLATNNMEILSGKEVIDPSTINWNEYEKNVPFRIRQKPGMDNALGKMKFLFPNSYSIYLHDTPSKSLFGQNKRAFSHGCIRVENPKKLALHILRKNKTYNLEKLDTILKTNEEYGIKIKPSIPVYIVYFTSWVDSAGQLNFRNDIYNLDKQLANEIFEDL
ncbi:murein L,D-transpeptidase [Flavobacterium sp. K5-23]|uniref:L,D-transpeptidase family protein n=1 Tax=Flavobacterium sp. K5-23 TaxID=2746225 RepID=UPI00200F3A16|nr:L,D-transpeptidase family protein [Flavobacterium sp. K5-23]UQD56680.1 L,D-transpeptidase family protein [Flavobacterium sp. K5-23]